MKKTLEPDCERRENSVKEDLYLENTRRIISKVSRIGIGMNLVLTIGKLAAGILGYSQAMISDAVHSLSDVFGSAVVLIGGKISSRAADEEHPYGHERFECIASMIVGNTLFFAAVLILWTAGKSLFHPSDIRIPSALPLIAAVVSIVTKEGLYQYTNRYAQKINSVSLKASAKDHRSDALSSIGSLAGIAGARLGFPVLDPVAGIVISFFIFRSSFEIFRDTADQVLDTACPKETEERFRSEIEEIGGISHIDDIRTRQFSSRIYVEVEISMPGDMSLFETHQKAKDIHDTLERENPEIKHIMVHVNPAEEKVHDIPEIKKEK
ncbi:MAG: cation diffusion facilitator family transporter [Eubacteriales bacterium]|nr:cation diffusion facilitator family transporter [Eubacteriales bacterium]